MYGSVGMNTGVQSNTAQPKSTGKRSEGNDAFKDLIQNSVNASQKNASDQKTQANQSNGSKDKNVTDGVKKEDAIVTKPENGDEALDSDVLEGMEKQAELAAAALLAQNFVVPQEEAAVTEEQPKVIEVSTVEVPQEEVKTPVKQAQTIVQEGDSTPEVDAAKVQVVAESKQVQTVQEENTPVQRNEQPVEKADKAVENAPKTETNATNEKQSIEDVTVPKETKAVANQTNQEDVEVKVVNTNEKTEEKTVVDNKEILVDQGGKKPEATDVVRVKVGDVVNVNEGNFAKDVSDQIIVKLPEKQGEFEIQLAPKDLGKITIKLAFEAGQAVVTMSCSNPKTMSLLAETAQQIGMIVENNTGQKTVVEVQDDKNLYQQQDDNNSSNGRQHGESQKEGRKDREDTIDFIQQMRLGLIDQSMWETEL